MKRRNFFKLSTGAGIALGLPFTSCTPHTSNDVSLTSEYKNLVAELLKEWCDGLISVQVDDPDNPELHGALYCSACDKIHGRCMDAVYPFLHMADKTGDQKYLKAAINVMSWSENVSKEDGSWTVIPNPKSWSGITVFGAIALGEALHYHGQILPKDLYDAWMTRLSKAAEFIHQKFHINFSHINYPFTAIYALNLLGRMFDNEEYLNHSRELAKEIPNWLTEPNKLIFGENDPSTKRSAKNLASVDIGYNVEESLNGLVLYAVQTKDESLLQLLTKSLEGHLEFMLPDGAWDNSWGTRQNKWSYWGSRTTDGCQPAYVLMADRNAAFGTAAYLNTELLLRCTVGGLLAGGLHYESHGLPPCVHHTFAHAKSLAFLLDNQDYLSGITKENKIPRSISDGVKHFPEIDVWLAAKGPWRATVSSYDAVFKKKYSQAATGGALALLYHDKVGPIFTASMAEYILVEKNNQQDQPDGEDISLTPRIECFKNDQWFTNLHDLEAGVSYIENNQEVIFDINTHLTNKEKSMLANAAYDLQYRFDDQKVTITAIQKDQPTNVNSSLVLPIISENKDQVSQISKNRIEIIKIDFKIVIEASVPISIMKTKKTRIFNMVPGMEAIIITTQLVESVDNIKCTIEVI